MNIVKKVINMVVYRKFSTNEKSMQEIMREVIIRYITENSCNTPKMEVELDKLGISNSIIN